MHMSSNGKKEDYRPSPELKAFQIFLLVLIIIGVALLITRDTWVPKLVDYILLQG